AVQVLRGSAQGNLRPSEAEGAIMIRAKRTLRKSSERQALHKRVNRMYEFFNKEAWTKCFSLPGSKASKAKKSGEAAVHRVPPPFPKSLRRVTTLVYPD